jgi:hypothetical protein
MVPHDQPASSLVMLDAFLGNSELMMENEVVE